MSTLFVLFEAVLFAAVTLLAFYCYSELKQKWKLRRAFRNIPSHPRQHWLFGHLPYVMDSRGLVQLLDMTCQLSKTTKLTVVNYGLFYDVVHLLHPQTLRPALGKDPKPEVVCHPLRWWLGNGLVLSSGKKWARDRRLLTNGFHFDILKPYIQIYSDCTEILMDIWSRHDKSFDMVPSIKVFTMDVLLRCICGQYTDCQNGTYNTYIEAVKEINRLSLDRMFHIFQQDWIYALRPSGWKYRKACQLAHNYSREIIQQRRKETAQGIPTKEKKGRRCLDFIDILLQVKDKDGVGLSDSEIREQVDTFMFAGHDTTANGLCWILYNLAKYPQHQQICQQEVDEIFNTKTDIEWDDLNKLTYLKCCIKESLRLFPPVPIVAKELIEDKTFDGHVLPKGTNLWLNFYAAHRNSDVWEDPEVFNPLRFTSENSAGRDPVAFVPFSAGSRNCIGQEFAMNELKVTLAHILRRYELLVDEDHPVERGYYLLLFVNSGLYLKLNKRKV